jgi:hypothetical protein
MFTEEQKTRIKNSVYSLPTKKRTKILNLASLLSDGENDDIEYDVMISYLDEDMDEELDKALKEAQEGGNQIAYLREEEEKLPSRLRMKK